ncbi:MAG: phosphatidate cytidylyltransferase [Blastomonas sp.]
MADDSSPGNARQRSELATRTLSAIVMVSVAMLALYLGGFAFWLLLTLGALAMQYEWAGLVGRQARARLSMLALTVPLSMLSPLASGPSFLAIGLIFGAMLFIWAIERGFALGWGIAYAAFPVLALLYLRQQDDGLMLALWAMSIVWATDIGAYFAGRAIGGPKLAPAISPSKTWAGLGGGVFAALLLGLLFYQNFGLPLVLALASGLLAVLAQTGDLLESHLKRQAGVKDSGNLIPGHGGVLDRVDGLVPVAPVAALVMIAQAHWLLG